jgi:hypothetical protein
MEDLSQGSERVKWPLREGHAFPGSLLQQEQGPGTPIVLIAEWETTYSAFPMLALRFFPTVRQLKFFTLSRGTCLYKFKVPNSLAVIYNTSDWGFTSDYLRA